MVLIDCLHISNPCVRVFAQKLAQSGNIRLAEKSVKRDASVLGAFVESFGALLEFPFSILIGSGDATGIDEDPSGQSCSLLHLNESIRSGCPG